MIEEAYVSFETAKLLKDKGFDEECYAYWHENEHKLIISQSMHAIQNVTNPCFFGNAAPTLQMAARWIREVHNIHIVIHPYTDMAGHHFTYLFDKYSNECWQELAIYLLDSYPSYEKALEAGIQYCLKELIN